MFRKIFTHTFHSAQEELQVNVPHHAFDRRVFIILGWTAIGLAIIHYWGDVEFFAGVLGNIGLKKWSSDLYNWGDSALHGDLHHLAWWVGTMLFVYLLVPFFIIKIIFKDDLQNFGWKWKGAFRSWWLYVLMLVVMVPLVMYFSSTKSFQSRYPFYNVVPGEKLWPHFWMWELLYFAQFIGLEFFFRGFITLGLKHRFGFYSIFIMMVPYCMIHFGKPMPETIGAILAGLVLGTLSMKSRSVFLGVLIHYSVAITMDLFSLWRKGLL